MGIKPKPVENFSPISKLINPRWKAHPERFKNISTDQAVTKSGGGGFSLFRGFPDLTPIVNMAQGGKVLDVACGVTFGKNAYGNYNSPVGEYHNAYGIDAAINPKDSTLKPYLQKVIGGRAEDMPFYDSTFRLTLSFQGVGYYPNVAFEPYWTIYEMIRVTEPGGNIVIDMGSGAGTNHYENTQIILATIDKLIRSEKLGRKVQHVRDFSNQPFSSVTIVLGQN